VSTVSTLRKRQERCFGVPSVLGSSAQIWPGRPIQRSFAMPSQLDARGYEGTLAHNLVGVTSS
jgi:hypothetical protein